MHIRRPPSGDGPRIYRPNESVAVRLEPAPRPVANEPESIPPPPRDSLLARVNRRRGQILTLMVSVAAIASFGSVVWWAHNQDVRAGGKGLEPLVIQPPADPARVKPENAGGYIPPNQDKEVYNRVAPGAVPVQPEKLLPGPTVPKLPANGLPVPYSPKPPEGDKTASATPGGSAAPANAASTASAAGQSGPTPAPTPAPPAPANQPTVTQAPTTTPTETGPSIASLIENMSGPSGGWRIQVASVKNEDVAKSTWARLQAAHGDVLASLRMQPTRVDLGDKGVWYRVQAGPLDEKQAQSVCSTLRSRKADCVIIPPAR
ncbi:Cell division protein FtsN [Enhydrobacter aerosaccus]|uniref:Cell division protein FtsN n=1 Tax=Enhydrobacter aerosaccus TaxID=225324 RepID=A0A1T4THW0_9HYPH|nr:SPOR domain-containing protein [Enhydrobacter aerosaccus]SKA39841.1 Cell division protein FtsN [Enhydrobacter aerosaccus]